MLFNSYETPIDFYHYFIVNAAVGTSVMGQKPLAWPCDSIIRVRITRACHTCVTVKLAILLY